MLAEELEKTDQTKKHWVRKEKIMTTINQYKKKKKKRPEKKGKISGLSYRKVSRFTLNIC